MRRVNGESQAGGRRRTSRGMSGTEPNCSACGMGPRSDALNRLISTPVVRNRDALQSGWQIQEEPIQRQYRQCLQPHNILLRALFVHLKCHVQADRL